MTETGTQEAIRDHIEWCRKERDAALQQTELFTEGGARALIQNKVGAPQDITERVVDHGREVAQMMGQIISVYEKSGKL
jgi:hypothetical protein